MGMFRKAVKGQDYLRMAILGPAGSGKTYTALRIATALVKRLGGRIAVLDTEHGSARKYADLFDFDHAELTSFAVERYIEGIRAAEAEGYTVLIIDSLSHAWAGKDGILEFVDNVARRMKENKFGAWREASPKHNELVETMLGARLHLIVTMRVKMEYVQEKDETTGKTVVRAVGLQPVQRDGVEYEFDVVADVDKEHVLAISKTRCHLLTDKVFRQPTGEEIAPVLIEWLGLGKTGNGQPAQAPAAPAPTAAPETTQGEEPPLNQLLEQLYAEGTKTPTHRQYVTKRLVEMGVAKAAQLRRDQVLALLDELRRLDVDGQNGQGPSQGSLLPEAPVPAKTGGRAKSGVASAQLLAELRQEAAKHGMDEAQLEAWVQERYRLGVTSLSPKQAREALETLQGMALEGV